MEWLTETFLSLIADQNNPVALLILAGSAAVEYVFPPFPGDTITLLGAILITGYGWNAPLVFGAVMVGSVGGAMLAFKFGLLWAERRARKRGEGADPLILDELVHKFRRYGAAYLVLNRFMPGLRALFFVAAGLARMKTLPVLIYSTVSAALWNLALIAVGALVGANLDSLKNIVRNYTIVAWIVVAVVAGLVAWRVWRARRRRRAIARQ